MQEREFYFEFRNVGIYTQVRAIDSITGTEVAVTTPSHMAKTQQMELAKRKLLMILQKNANG